MSRRGIAFVLVTVIGTSILTACDMGAAGADTSASGVETAEPVEVAEPVETAEPEKVDEWEGEIDEIHVLLADQRGNGESIKSIEDAMNAITEKTIGVHANIQLASFGEYNTQFGLQVSSGEPLDVASLLFEATGFSTLVANQQLYDLTDLLSEYAPEMMDIMGEYIVANSVNGRILGVPPYRNYASANYFYMRTDVLEDLDIVEQAKAVDSFTDMEEIYKIVQEKTDLAPTASTIMESGIIYTGDQFADYYTFDQLGDTYRLIYTDPEGNTSLLLERDDYRKMMDRVKGWYDNKYLYQDMLITDDHQDTIMKAGSVFSNIQLSEMGVEASKKAATGYDVTVIEMSKNMLTSSTVNKFGLCVPVTTQEPEAAVRWINAIYTDPELINLLDWGIEGRDYVVNENNEAAYPDGVDAASVPYHSYDFFLGNFFNALPWEGNGADFRQRAYDYLKFAEISPFMGFAADQSGFTNLVSQINTVYMKYYKDIRYGAYDDDEWNAYVAELHTAGIDDYLQAYQDQLSAWKEAQAR